MMPQLSTLKISSSSLQALPLSFCRISTLTILYLIGNPKMHELPECIGTMPAVTALYLQNSGFTQLPNSIVTLGIGELFAQGNPLCDNDWFLSNEASAVLLRRFSSLESLRSDEYFMGCNTHGLCAPQCNFHWHKDLYCNPQCNIEACNCDSGRCSGPRNPVYEHGSYGKLISGGIKDPNSSCTV